MTETAGVMRAAVFAKPGRPLLVVNDRPKPSPGPGEVLLRVSRCGICKTDLVATSGAGSFLAAPNTVLGHEFAGEVVACGDGVHNRSVGDRVAALPLAGCGSCASCVSRQPYWCASTDHRSVGAAFAEFAVASARETVLLPESVSDDEGALVEPLTVGLHGVLLAKVSPGMRVAIQGAGPIGLAAMFWAQRFGAGPLVVIETSPARERFAQALGSAGYLVAKADVAAQVAQELGGPPDVVIEAAGSPGAIGQALDMVKPRGAVVSLGFLTSNDTIVPARALLKEARLQFSVAYGVPEFEFTVATLARGAKQLGAMITRTISLSQLPDVFDSLRHRADYCKVLVDPSA